MEIWFNGEAAAGVVLEKSYLYFQFGRTNKEWLEVLESMICFYVSIQWGLFSWQLHQVVSEVFDML